MGQTVNNCAPAQEAAPWYWCSVSQPGNNREAGIKEPPQAGVTPVLQAVTGHFQLRCRLVRIITRELPGLGDLKDQR